MVRRVWTTRDATPTGSVRASSSLAPKVAGTGSAVQPLSSTCPSRLGVRSPGLVTHRSAFTLIEMAIVMAIIVILAALAIPSLTGLTRMSSEGAMRTALRSLFASARARAATTQHYVGIRFQQDQNGRSWAVMLQQVPPSADFPNGCPAYDPNAMYLTFVAAGDTEPIELPRGVEVAAGDYLQSLDTPGANPNPADTTPWNVDSTRNVPATSFVVAFSPSGQIVRRQVHVTQRRDTWDNSSGTWTRTWSDPVFNFAGSGMFQPDVQYRKVTSQDTDPNPQSEPYPPTKGPNFSPNGSPDLVGPPRMSEGSVWIYEHQKRVDAGAKPFTGYVKLSGILVPLNVYTGAPVNTQQNTK